MRAGVSRIMKVMDWGDVADMVTFGEVSAEDADDPADVFLLLAPQNIVGNTIMTNLSDMVRHNNWRRGGSAVLPAVCHFGFAPLSTSRTVNTHIMRHGDALSTGGSVGSERLVSEQTRGQTVL